MNKFNIGDTVSLTGEIIARHYAAEHICFIKTKEDTIVKINENHLTLVKAWTKPFKVGDKVNYSTLHVDYSDLVILKIYGNKALLSPTDESNLAVFEAHLSNMEHANE